MALTLLHEKRFLDEGFAKVAGIDEVGRGPLAGPIIAAAVILPLNCKLPGLHDSKKLTPSKREKLFVLIKKQALAIGMGAISHRTIDKIGIGRANKLVMQQALDNLTIKPDLILLDGGRSSVTSNLPQRAITGGDRKLASIAAASIIAKVTRDRMMLKFHDKYPDYRFDRHKGYGTKLHLRILYQIGPCAIHRRSFFPVSELA